MSVCRLDGDENESQSCCLLKTSRHIKRMTSDDDAVSATWSSVSCVKGRSVRQISSSTSPSLDIFLLSEASSNFDNYYARWIVGASFDAFPVADSLYLPFPLPSPLPYPLSLLNVSDWLSLINNRTKPVLIGHFTVESYHAIALSLALIDLAKLRYFAPNTYHIHTINHPLPRQPETVVMDKVICINILIPLVTTFVDRSEAQSWSPRSKSVFSSLIKKYE